MPLYGDILGNAPRRSHSFFYSSFSLYGTGLSAGHKDLLVLSGDDLIRK